MRRALAHALLVAGLALAGPVAAQFGTPNPAVQADSHIFSAFTTRTDPGVLSDRVTLGPALREQLAGEADRRRIYEALIGGIADKPLRSRSLSADETTSYASLGVNSADPLVLVAAGDVRLLMQYSLAEKSVSFVEQLAGTAIAAAPPPAAQPQAKAPPPEPIVEKTLPAEPPPAPVAPAAVAPAPAAAAAAPLATPKPSPAPKAAAAAPKPAPKPRVAPVAAVPAAPKSQPAAKPAAAAPAKPRPDRPRGECVIKPVMNEDDLWNCSAPGLASSPQIDTPAPAVTATSAFATQPAVPPPAECVIKPVMSEQEMKVCAAASRSRPSAPVEMAAPVAAVKPSPPPTLQPAPPPDCVIKPVMTEADMKACAAASRAAPSTPAMVEPSAPAVAATSAPVLQTAPARDCVIKPVMSEEDLRVCAAASRSPQVAPAEVTAAPFFVKPTAATPAAPAVPRDCVIKPVMSEEDLRACGSRR